MKKAGIVRALGVLGIVAAVGLVAGGSGASATSKAKDVAVIKAKLDGKELFWKGPKSVGAGDVLKVKSTTDPMKVGPHTFSLVKPKTLPTEPKEIKACSRKLEGICGAIAFNWHKVVFDEEDPDAPPEIGRPFVEAGKKGWDTEGNLKRRGDSILLQEAGQPASFKQVVSASDGDTLTFICAIHAEMQGEIAVKG